MAFSSQEAGVSPLFASWGALCETRSTKWVYKGICAKALVFGMLLELQGLPTFKQNKYLASEVEGAVGELHRVRSGGWVPVPTSDSRPRYPPPLPIVTCKLPFIRRTISSCAALATELSRWAEPMAPEAWARGGRRSPHLVIRFPSFITR